MSMRSAGFLVCACLLLAAPVYACTAASALDKANQMQGTDAYKNAKDVATEELDGGPPIIQGKVKVEPDDTAKSLAARALKVEHRIYPEAAALFAAGRLEYRDSAAWLDGKALEKPIQFN